MTDAELDILIRDNKENLKEMFAFWTFIRNINKVAKWIVYIGAPFAIGIWSIRNWIKTH